MLEEGVALGITYGALALFGLVAGVAVPLIYKRGGADAGADGVDFWYSARNSQTWVSLGLSFYASSMGAWVLFAAPEVGALSGWWGTIGYSIGSTFPFAVMAVLGPMVRRRYPEGFCLSDWVRERFGRPTQIYVSLMSVFYMFVYLVAELTTMGGLLRDFTGLDPLHALVPMSLVTMFYTMAAGLPASIWTDRVQGVLMLIAIAMVLGACISDVTVKEEHWNAVAQWTDKGFESFVTLTLAILGAELFNMGSWQRVYAAKDEGHLRKGLAFGVALIFPTMFLFGIVGMLADAQDRGREPPTLVIKALAFFDLMGSQPTWVIGMTYTLAVCMVASSVDSLQTGIVSVISQEVKFRNLKPAMATAIGQIFVLSVNIPAIAFSAEATKDVLLGFNVINLFLIADLLTLSCVVPIFAGLGGFATQNGTLAGCASGVLTIMCAGWIEFGTFMAGIEMLTLMSFGNIMPPEAGLTASRTCILCFVLPFITGAVTFLVSWMERVFDQLKALNGDKAVTTPAKELPPTCNTDSKDIAVADPQQNIATDI